MARNHIHQHSRLVSRLNRYQLSKRSNKMWYRSRIKPSLSHDLWVDKGISSRLPFLPAFWGWLKNLFRKEKVVLV